MFWMWEKDGWMSLIVDAEFQQEGTERGYTLITKTTSPQWSCIIAVMIGDCKHGLQDSTEHCIVNERLNYTLGAALVGKCVFSLVHSVQSVHAYMQPVDKLTILG